MRWEYDSYMQNYDNNLEKINKKAMEITLIIKKTEEDIKIQENIIKENQDKTINIEKAGVLEILCQSDRIYNSKGLDNESNT